MTLLYDAMGDLEGERTNLEPLVEVVNELACFLRESVVVLSNVFTVRTDGPGSNAPAAEARPVRGARDRAVFVIFPDAEIDVALGDGDDDGELARRTNLSL
jgi:hypothetical protein